MTPEQYKKIHDEQNKIIEAAWETIQEAYEKASKCSMPKNLRPATAADIVIDAVLWYPEFGDEQKWLIVEEILSPHDDFKAFVSDDGSRYGLDGAFVEVKND